MHWPDFDSVHKIFIKGNGTSFHLPVLVQHVLHQISSAENYTPCLLILVDSDVSMDSVMIDSLYTQKPPPETKNAIVQ